jgi:hypothetical protein
VDRANRDNQSLAAIANPICPIDEPYQIEEAELPPALAGQDQKFKDQIPSGESGRSGVPKRE